MNASRQQRWIFPILIAATLGTSIVRADDGTDDVALDDLPMDVVALQDSRGGTLGTTDMLVNTAEEHGWLGDNQLQSHSTGMNVTGAGAFLGSNGISTIIQNTGNQVLIQQTTQINVLFSP